jgi:hypothetical protein
MLQKLFQRAFVLALGVGAVLSSHAADYSLRTRTTIVPPTTRGAANTTWFGWDSFGNISDPIDDDTPDIGTTTTGVRFRTLSATDHTSSSGNYYSFGNPANEEVTVVTNGTPGATGRTTVIAQLVTLFGGFAAPWVVGEINGVKPVAVVQGPNSTGRGQLWAMWELPGNAATYTFTLNGVPGGTMYSFDRIEIDTFYDPAGGSHPDGMVLAPPASFTLNREANMVTPTTRGARNTTHFGWDTFEDPANYAVPGTALNDTTPDITSAMTPAGVRFESLHGNKNRASSGNFYSGFAEATSIVNERVTVVTNGTVGATGKTTILLQIIAGSFAGNPSNFASTWQFSAINGVEPTQVLQTRNGGGFGQVWVRWELPGNETSYQFTITSATNAHMSFDRIQIDTLFDADGEAQPDSMILSEPAAMAHIMDQVNGPVIPSSRGGRDTTYFGWDTFGTVGSIAPINDNTPDIGSDPTGLARFRTTNGEIHQMAGGANLYFLSGTLAEEITVPTAGLPGNTGFTTIMLQIASASSGFGGANFPAPITVSSINGVAPTVVQGSSSASAQFWARWVIPGNAPSYTIAISGPPGQAHFSFDRVIVDTKYSRYEGVGDTMRAQTVQVTTTTLADTVKGTPFSVQLEADGGTTPRTWALASGSAALPAGLSLSSAGLLTGATTMLGTGTFTVEVTEGGGFRDQQELSLTVLSNLQIATAALLPTAVVGLVYEMPLVATLGLAPYTWSVTAGELPAGVTLSEAGVISGTPTTAGEATATIQVADAEGGEVERVFTLPVSATLLAPVMQPVQMTPTLVGAEMSHTLSALNYPAGYVVNGLPAGLRLQPTTGQITGRVAVPGAYPLQVRAVNAAGASPWVPAMVVVRALPSAFNGSFTAWSTRGAVNGSLGSAISLRTTVNGSYTVAVRTGAVTRSARGFLNTAAPQVQVEVSGGLLALTIDPQTGAITGTHGGAVVSGWRAVWDRVMNPASGREGYYSVALELDAGHASVASLPKGVGFATFTVPANGILRIAGRTADGQPVVSSGPLGPNGEIAVYAPQHGNKGSVIGQWELAEDAAGLFADNEITGTLSWQKPETKGRVYAAAFGPVTVNASGSYLAQSARGQTVLGLPDLGEFALKFSEGGIGESATVADVSGINWTERFLAVMPSTGNAAQVSVRIHRSTGVMSGAFSLTEMTPPLVRRNVSFFGQVVRTADAEVKAVGYFLLPQIPTAGQRPNATPILSGAVFAVQAAD